MLFITRYEIPTTDCGDDLNILLRVYIKDVFEISEYSPNPWYIVDVGNKTNLSRYDRDDMTAYQIILMNRKVGLFKLNARYITYSAIPSYKGLQYVDTKDMKIRKFLMAINYLLEQTNENLKFLYEDITNKKLKWYKIFIRNNIIEKLYKKYSIPLVTYLENKNFI